NQPGKQGENQPGKQGENQPGKQGENQPGKQGENQPGKQGENQPGKQGENQPGKQGENQPGKQGENQPGKQGENQPGNDKGQAGSGPGKDPNDKGDLGKLMDEVAKNKKPFEAKAAESNDKKGQDVDADAARKRELALDTLADKLRRGDIDRQLADKLKELKLTKEEALKLVQNQKTDRVRGAGKQADQLTGKSLTGVKQRTEQIIDPATDVPDELSSSYRSFTEKRNQPKK
ncbi:MAG TPA: hypothetical protein PLN21_18090, partial [Gemmatales bacterium]|nr:hypothetical protein [Gemmatales bacterium]